MENFRNNPRALVLIAQLFSAGMLVIYLLMLTLDARGQAFNNQVFVRPGQTIHAAHQVALVRKAYTSQIGVREKYNNSGKEVEQYLKYVNLPKGNPWCAAFVCWVFGEAGVGNPRTGWTPGLFGEGRIVWASGEPRAKNQESRHLPSVLEDQGTRSMEQGLPPSVPGEPGTMSKESRTPTYVPRSYPSSLKTNNQQLTTPSTGDVFGLYFPEKARIAHVGFIDEWKDPWVVTVEGNTNVLGSREGDGVYRKRRLVRSVYKVARYVN